MVFFGRREDAVKGKGKAAAAPNKNIKKGAWQGPAPRPGSSCIRESSAETYRIEGAA